MKDAHSYHNPEAMMAASILNQGDKLVSMLAPLGTLEHRREGDTIITTDVVNEDQPYSLSVFVDLRKAYEQATCELRYDGSIGDIFIRARFLVGGKCEAL